MKFVLPVNIVILSCIYSFIVFLFFFNQKPVPKAVVPSQKAPAKNGAPAKKGKPVSNSESSEDDSSEDEVFMIKLLKLLKFYVS